MRRVVAGVRVVVGALACVLVMAGCGGGGNGAEAQAAVSTALHKQLVGGTLGDCLDTAGFVVDPDQVKAASPGSDGWARVDFASATDSTVTVHVAVSTDAGAVIPYGSYDQQQLTKMGCDLGAKVYGF